MRQFRNKLTPVLLLVMTWSIAAAANDPGSSGFSFLKVSPGARNAGMGDIGLAVPSNLYGVYFNPAVTGDVKETYVGFMHHEYIFDTRREFLGACTPLFKGALSVGFDYFKIGSIENRTGPSDDPLATSDARDILFYGSYALPLSQRFALGATAKFAAERIEPSSARTLLFDLGARFKPTAKLSFGIAGRNIGGKPKFNSEAINMPVTIAGGVAFEVNNMTAGVDVSKPKDAAVKVNLGLERYIVEYIALRAGYKFGYDEENMAFGVGFSRSIWRVDYAFVPFKSGLGSSHRFALTVALK
jgi:hypothetical protein